MMISMSGMNVMAAEQQETREGYVEIALDNAASTYATNYYSKGLVVLNIATAGVSNECRITSGSVPNGATITKVELKYRLRNCVLVCGTRSIWQSCK